MVYNFNLGIGWASSGVEYAQSYRAGVLRKIGIDAKFVFTDMFSRDNIAEMTENIGFLDSEVIWLYTYFSDFKVAPVSYTVEQLKKSLGGRKYTERIDGSTIVLDFEGTGNFYRVYLTKEGSNLVHRVEIVENNCLIRKDYFTYCTEKQANQAEKGKSTAKWILIQVGLGYLAISAILAFAFYRMV